MSCLAETCANWTGHGCACAVMDVVPVCVPCLMGETCRDHGHAEDEGQDR
jgi:hypothetical protein